MDALVSWAGVFIVAVATHYGHWKPTGVSVKAQESLVKPRRDRPHQA